MMDARDRFRNIEALFRDALRRDATARERFVRDAAGADPKLAAEVLALLRADETEAGALDRPLLQGVMGLALESNAPPPTPERVGPYRIVGVIGEGGMGVVYEAEQENPRRRVAIKVLRPGLSTAAVRKRFALEAQILGRLEHEGIARIYEAGSTGDGGLGMQPYVVMELVRGRSLLDFANDRNLDVNARLELMAMVCDAMHYAHQNGILHRDLKPGNILVTEDRSASIGLETRRRLVGVQPKILDFGVARLTQTDVPAVTVQTTVGELIGTVPYMSPEQAAGDPGTIDWRSDVYSLGVILFELLTGRLPHNLHGRSVHEAVRMICEEEPLRARSIEPPLRGDVDAILGKALEKEPSARYQTAADLARDIRRHLNDEPITARPLTALAQLRKFSRRNKALVGGTALAFAAMLIGTIVSLRQMIVANQARRQSETDVYRASVLAASAAVYHHDAAGARRHLDAAPEHLRGWEWRHLQSRVDDRLAGVHTTFTPMCLDLSPDGSTIASAASSGHIHLWRTTDLSAAGSLKIQGTVGRRRPYQLQFLNQNSQIRADTTAGSALLRVDDGAEIGGDQQPTRARTRDGAIAVWAEVHGKMQSLVVGRVEGRSRIFSIDDLDVGLSRFAFSDQGDFFVLATADHRGVSLHRVTDGELLWSRPDLGRATDFAFSRDQAALALIDQGGSIRVLQLQDGSDIDAFPAPTSPATTVDFLESTEFVATGSVDGTLRLWSVPERRCVSVMHGLATMPFELRATSDGRRLVSIGAAGGLSLWDASVRSDPFVIEVAGAVYDLAVSPDGRTLAVACLLGEPSLQLFDLPSGRERLSVAAGHLSAITFSANGTMLAVGRSSGATTICNASDLADIARAPGHEWRTDWVGLSHDASVIYSLGNTGRLWRHDVATGQRTHQWQCVGNVAGHGCRAIQSPDGKLIAVAGGTIVTLLDAHTFEVLRELRGHTDHIWALAFDASGARLASGGRDRTIRVWGLESGDCIATLSGHTEEIFAVAFSPDDHRLLSGGRDRVIRVWDPIRFEELTQLHGHSSYIYCLAFTPDGQTLFSGGGDATVRIWTTIPLREHLGQAPGPSSPPDP